MFGFRETMGKEKKMLASHNKIRLHQNHNRLQLPEPLVEFSPPIMKSWLRPWASQVSAETDPVSLLPKVVSLLCIQLHHKALQAPGRAISVAIIRLKDKLEDSAYNILTDYQAATVTLLPLLSATTGNDEDSI